MTPFLSPALIGFIVLGAALLWAVHLLYWQRRSLADDPLRRGLTIAGIALILLGQFGALMAIHVLIAIPVEFVLLLMILVAVRRYRDAELRALVSILAVAVEHGLPLDQAARAFATEREGELGFRALRLADNLAAGVPLREALIRSRNQLPFDAMLALEVGLRTGSLKDALQGATRIVDEFDNIARSAFERLMYLLFVVNVGLVIITFVTFKIVPVFQKMFAEFDIKLPPVTLAVINASYLVQEFLFLLAPVLLLLPVLLAAGVLHYVGWLPPGVPLINRLGQRLDSARIMRMLALPVANQRPLLPTLVLLSERYPKGFVRRRLRRAIQRINDGEDWCDSLAETGLIRRSDAAVLAAAQRVGNLAWALEEMADSSLRRYAYRLQGWLSVLFPAAILLLGLLVLVFVLGLFLPLITLIQGLA